jgi:hypothetical protein
MVLDLSDESSVIRGNEVDGHTFSTISTCSTNSVNIVFFLEWKFVVDDQIDLLDIDTSGKNICSNEDLGGT